MSLATAYARVFYRDVARHRLVWVLRDSAGQYPALPTGGGRLARPLWSSRSRVLRIIRSAPGYARFEPVAVTWTDLRKDWLPALTRDGLLVGVNWSGAAAHGIDLEPADLRRNVEAAIKKSSTTRTPRAPRETRSD